MKIFNTFTINHRDATVQSLSFDEENQNLVIAQSNGNTRIEILVDLAGAYALRDALDETLESIENTDA